MKTIVLLALSLSFSVMAESVKLKLDTKSFRTFVKSGNAYISQSASVQLDGEAKIKLGLFKSEKLKINKSQVVSEPVTMYILAEEIRLVETVNGNTIDNIYPAKIKNGKITVKGKYFSEDAEQAGQVALQTELQNDFGGAKGKVSVKADDLECKIESSSMIRCEQESKMTFKISL